MTNICILCQRDEETVNHFHYSFSQSVWEEVKKIYRIAQGWNFQTVDRLSRIGKMGLAVGKSFLVLLVGKFGLIEIQFFLKEKQSLFGGFLQMLFPYLESFVKKRTR